tara:strand:- start:9597 stop:10121 length:525 start_codon:yes stop_codon:yes gene_type:complete
MENKKPSPAKYSINFGLINGSFGIILGLMLYALDMHYQNDPIVQIIAALVGIFIIMFGIIQFKNENKGFLNLSDALKLGLGISLVGGLISVVFNYLMMNFIDPDTLEKGFEFAKQKMLSNDPEMSVETANQFIEMSKGFYTPISMALTTVIVSLIFGFIVSLIGGLIVKKSQPE